MVVLGTFGDGRDAIFLGTCSDFGFWVSLSCECDALGACGSDTRIQETDKNHKRGCSVNRVIVWGFLAWLAGHAIAGILMIMASLLAALKLAGV